ncbi:hypothetical protein CEUSTIGMA_g5.t1 [Chlamydomonas eustigma]|uniref:Uncharacterized protein n=1 Tax=Chlamydomonas eustigma TaxID=1157962 RepID=A0A250WPD4_9CHLO|nr:hypothetical protein CEUSTIGMA_g5.t1 [Chlamydomonas eustigma]|eukprot:GAX72549.1 hypothetical protein CEUSTIGMA_g5.t1 [Chlamydomonas eustigma]
MLHRFFCDTLLPPQQDLEEALSSYTKGYEKVKAAMDAAKATGIGCGFETFAADMDPFCLGSFVNMVLDIGHQGMRDEAIKFIEETYASVSLMFAKGSGSTFYTFKKLVGFSDVEAMVEKLVGHIVVLKVKVVKVARSKANLPI